MNTLHRLYACLLLLGLCVAAWPTRADEPGTVPSPVVTDPEDTETVPDADLDTTKPTEPPRTAITEKATALQLSDGRVDALRDSGMGWGEIENALDLSADLAAKSETPLTGDQALTEIMQLRSEGLGWGEIAKRYDLNLGKSVSAGRGKNPHADTVDRTDVDRPDATERHDQPERPDVPDHVGRPENAGRPEHAHEAGDHGKSGDGAAESHGRPDNPGRGKSNR
ncbi:MAG: hypothetical protein K8T26_16295 [Lentisphaerae bacterium]|nr:hypothetical protein [Lentisphaerota bacterium]